jgi:hypothetical protein
MFATIPEFREVDFSHLTLTTDSALESVEPARNPQSSLLLVALLLSLLLHLSFLLFNFSDKQFLPKPVPAQTLRIDLVQLPTKKLDVLPEIVTEEIVARQAELEAVKEVVALPIIAKEIVTADKTDEAKPITRLVIESLSAQELAEIVDSHNEQPDYENAPLIVENVFHPELRKKLIAASKERRKKRIEDEELSADYIDPSGAVRIETGMGTCISTPQDNKPGAPRNWYVSRCKGKSESERAMERVEQSINGKLEFDESD